MVFVPVVLVVLLVLPPGDLVFGRGDLITVEDLLGYFLGLGRSVVALEPLGQSALVFVTEACSGLWQDLCAFLEAVEVVDAQKTEADVLSRIVLFREVSPLLRLTAMRDCLPGSSDPVHHVQQSSQNPSS